ncbi:MAG: zinc ABC transporter substrate-binding protein [Chloroflexi bacterium]|nr:zinc ABC transporter substrate-binding protein [Chloroflexota bacterium]
MRFRIVIAAILGALVFTAACGESDDASDRLQVVATIYPLGYFAERVGGDRAEVEVLVGPGIEAHSFEPTPSDLLALGDADVIVMNGIGLEPWMDGAIDAIGDDLTAIVVEAADPTRAMEGEVHTHGEDEADHHDDEGDHGHEDADEEGHHDDEDADDEGHHHDEDEGEHHDEEADEEGHHHDEDEGEHHDEDADEEGHHHDEDEGEHGDEEGHHDEDGEHHDEDGHHEGEESALDPHMWLSPTLAALQVERIRDALVSADADNADGYRQRADELIAELNALEQEFAEGLAACKHDHFVTSHAAYGYLAAQFGLEQIPVAGLSADVEPSPQRLANVTDRVTELQLGHVLVESVLSDRLAQTVARETGIELLTIHAIESVTPNELEAHGDYFGLMRDNLANLRIALECE